MKNKELKNIILSALFISIGLILPFFTGQMREIGKMLLPMHIPVILCGFICGWQYGLIVGGGLPLLRSLLFGMPIMYPNAVAMAFELATYGVVVGFLYSRSEHKCIKSVYASMILAMISGRIVWGITEVILLGIGANGFTLKMFIAGAFLEAVPGIILQLVLIPIILVALRKAKLIPLSERDN